MSRERDYTNDYEAWLAAGGDPDQGQPEPPQGVLAPPGPTPATPTAATTTPTSSTTTKPPYDPTKDPNKPPAPFPGYEWYWTDTDGWRARPINTTPITGGPTPTGSPSSSFSFEGGGWPEYNAPDFVDPGIFDPGPSFSFPDFTYEKFVGPQPDQIQNDPSFQWRMDQGRKALEASAAGRGTLRSGGTLKDVLKYGQNFASQEYGNIWNRALTEYDTNRDNAFGSWNANRGKSFDEWNSGYTGRKDAYSFGANRANSLNDFNLNNSQFDYSGRTRNMEFDRQKAFDKWLAEGNWLSDLSVAGLNS